jgi:hypothetical protein
MHTVTTEDTAQAPADLTIEVYTTPGRTFVSAITPEGPGDEATWSPTSATLIYGDHDAILVGEVPAAAEKVLPQLLTTDTIDLEGNELRVIRIGQADTAESTVLHVPSLAAVVTGDLANDPKIIEESQHYLRDFSRIAAEETTTAGIVARMVERHPDWDNQRTLWHSARTAIARKDGGHR